MADLNVGITITRMERATLFPDLPQIRLVEHHPTIGSTNDRARELARQGTPEIALISADEQTAGRGRHNRTWYTPRGTALAFSLLTRPSLPARQAMRLTMLAGLAAVEGIEQASGLRLDLKWPNDVVAIIHEQLPTANNQQPTTNNQPPMTRKVGGILTECAFQGDAIDYAIVGIGINVNVDFSSQPELLRVATSLRNLKGNEIDRLAVLEAIVKRFVEKYAWLKDEGKLRAAWSTRLINLGRVVKVQTGTEMVEGLSEGVDIDGALLVRSNDGQLHRLLSGDVTLQELA